MPAAPQKRSLTERREHLLLQSEALRQEIGLQLHQLRASLPGGGAKPSGSLPWQRHPLAWTAGAGLLLTVWRPRRWLRWVGRGLWVWRAWRTLQPWAKAWRRVR
jgi:hypothetical protein